MLASTDIKLNNQVLSISERCIQPRMSVWLTKENANEEKMFLFFHFQILFDSLVTYLLF